MVEENTRKYTHTYTRAAIEKEPFTLEKDKEDQSKYYLRYQKPSVLDMKWENHDMSTLNSTHQAKKQCNFDSD